MGIIIVKFDSDYNPNLEIDIHNSALSSHSWALRKTIIEPSGVTQVLHKPPKYEHSAYSKNPISRFGYKTLNPISGFG